MVECAQTPGDSEEQGSLACRSPRGRRVGHDLGTKQQQKNWRIFERFFLFLSDPPSFDSLIFIM